MIKFDDKNITEALKKKKLYSEIAYVFFAVLLVSAIVAAVLTRGAVTNGENRVAHIAALCVFGAALICFIALLIFFVIPANRQLKLLVSKALADGLLAREDMLKGGGTLEFTADYQGDVLTLSRKGYTGVITLDPSRMTTADNLGGAGAKAELDLKPLKSSPSLYAAAGNRLLLFLQAYYLLHGSESGAESVAITDNMGKTPLTLQVYKSGTTVKNANKNYFIKKGLIK